MEDAGEFASWIATCLRGLASWGLGPATRLAGIGSPSPLHISNQVYAALLAGRPSAAPRLTVTTPLPEVVAALNAFQPEALTAYPSVAAALAEEQLQGRLRISPGLVATSSEVQTADMRRRMAAAWGVTPIDFYGTTEALIPAAGRQGQTGMDILEDLVVVEVRSSTSRPGSRCGLRCASRPRPTPRPGSGRRLTASSATPAQSRPPIQVTVVPGIDRDPGHGAKFKLVRGTVPRG